MLQVSEAMLLSSLALGLLLNQPILLVLNKGDNTVWITDMGSAKVRAKLPTGPNPNEVAISPDGTIGAISDMGTGREPGKSITLVDLKKDVVFRTIKIDSQALPHGIHWLNNRKLVFTSHATDSVVELDVEKGEITRTIPTEQKGTHLVVFSPDQTMAYTVNAVSETVSVIDFVAGKVLKQITCGTRAEGISISADGKWVACGNVAANTVSIIDTKSQAVSHTIDGVGGPIRTLFSGDGKHLAVSSVGSGKLEVYETSSWKKTKSVDLKQKPVASPQYGDQWPVPMNLFRMKNGNLLVVLVTSHVVAEVDTKRWEVIRTFETGPLPDGMAVAGGI